MLNAAESDTFTFKSAGTTVSIVGRVAERGATSLTKSPAVEAAAADFAAIAEERASLPKSGGAADRLAAIRANIAKSRATADELGEKALGIAPEPRKAAAAISDEDLIAKAAKAAVERFGAPAAATGGEPGRQTTPAMAKSADIQKA